MRCSYKEDIFETFKLVQIKALILNLESSSLSLSFLSFFFFSFFGRVKTSSRANHFQTQTPHFSSILFGNILVSIPNAAHTKKGQKSPASIDATSLVGLNFCYKRSKTPLRRTEIERKRVHSVNIRLTFVFVCV